MAELQEVEKSAMFDTKVFTMLEGLGNLPIMRQLGLMIGLAAAVALGTSLVLWTQVDDFRPLYGQLEEEVAMELVVSLEESGYPFKLTDSGQLLVPAEEVRDIRRFLASQGLPVESATGYALLDQDQGLGTSQFMEQARFRRSIEGELAKTISGFQHIRSARVHIAMPKQTVFVRDFRKPSAAINIALSSGRALDGNQVAAITHLVASAIPNLEPGDVTVVDQRGRLLTEQNDKSGAGKTAKQFAFARKMEAEYKKRINHILFPVLGAERYFSEVDVDLDFSAKESTQESFNPDLPALRSEQSFQENQVGSVLGGTPGALANQPPGGAIAPETSGQLGVNNSNDKPGRNTIRSTKNFELDRTISHIKQPTWQLRRLTVSVVVDDHQATDPDTGALITTPRTAEELARIESIIINAIGYNARRGDNISVINTPFTKPEVAVVVELPAWQQPWFADMAKQVVLGLILLILALTVFNPIFKGLIGVKDPGKKGEMDDAFIDDHLSLSTEMEGDEIPILASISDTYDKKLDAIKGLVADDAARVAQVLKNWVNDEGD